MMFNEYSLATLRVGGQALLRLSCPLAPSWPSGSRGREISGSLNPAAETSSSIPRSLCVLSEVWEMSGRRRTPHGFSL